MKPLNKYFDHTLLKAEAKPVDIEKLCAEAKEYDFYSVCVNSCYVEEAAKLLKDTDVKIAAVVGFPLGACTTKTKAFETEEACRGGASEVDMVLNVGMLKAGRDSYVEEDIRAVVQRLLPQRVELQKWLHRCLNVCHNLFQLTDFHRDPLHFLHRSRTQAGLSG